MVNGGTSSESNALMIHLYRDSYYSVYDLLCGQWQSVHMITVSNKERHCQTETTQFQIRIRIFRASRRLPRSQRHPFQQLLAQRGRQDCDRLPQWDNWSPALFSGWVGAPLVAALPRP